jgi:undecaprenyl diphosphate synthase
LHPDGFSTQGPLLNDPHVHRSLQEAKVPRHVAFIMDGNGRWAKQRGFPRSFGHTSGARRVRSVVEHAIDRGIPYVTLFAFSSENWRRPLEEVSTLMSLFVLYLEKEVKDMNDNGVRLKIIGDISRFDARLQKLIVQAEALTAHNTRVTVTVAANFGGRWDLVQAMGRWQAAHEGAPATDMTEEALKPFLSMAYAPDPDLLVRTGGESRVSNFLLWQLAYTEMYFTDVLWPDFTPDEFDRALAWFVETDRRFGGVSQKVSV